MNLNYRWLWVFGAAGLAIASCSDDDGDDGAGTGGAAVTGGSSGAASGGKLGGGGTGGGAPKATGGAKSGGSGGSTTSGGSSNGGAPSGGSGTGGDSGGAPPTEGGAAGDSGGGAAPTGGMGGGGGTGGTPSGGPTCEFPEAANLGMAALPDGFCAWNFATDIPSARGIAIDSAGNALVVSVSKSDGSKSVGSVIALWDEDGDGVSGDGERETIASVNGLNHGIALHGDHLYASTATTVYRWSYAADRMPLGMGTAVVSGIPSGGHSTRTLAFDDEYLYVSVGSQGNVDQNSERARIRRFPIAELESNPAFAEGEVFADGLRNEVGLRFDSMGRLWGVENGRDNLERDDIGGDIHQDNPAEELNLFAEPGKFYGYPYCFSEYALDDEYALGPGAQWADPEFMDDGTHTDEWCRDPANVVPPVLSMQGHSAPLDLLFYPGGSFPAPYTNDLFVTFHGSWNRTQATGYKVMHVPFGDDGMPTGEVNGFLESMGSADDDWPHRPVALAVLPSGVLLVTSDASNRVIAVGYAGE